MKPESPDLPAGWRLLPLSRIAGKPQYGWTTKARAGAPVKLVRTTDITSGRVDWASVPGCDEAPANLEKYELHSGDIVVSRAGSVGFSYLVDDTCPPGAVFASYLMRVRPDADMVLPSFLSYFMKSPQYWGMITDAAVGIGVANVNATKLGAISVPVPPLAVQGQLTFLLDAASTSILSATNHLASARKAIERFRQAVLVSACSGRLTADWRGTQPPTDSAQYREQIEALRKEAWYRRPGRRKYNDADRVAMTDLSTLPESWEWLSADQVCSQITDGEHIQPPYESRGYPMLTAKHVRDGFVDAEGGGLISEPAFRKALERCAPANGDILVVSVGATTGRSAIVENRDPFVIVRSVLLLKPLIPSRFLLRWLQSPHAFRWMRDASGASAQPHLYIRDVKKLPVPFPPLAEQLEIVRRVDELFALADSLVQRLETAKRRVERSSQALLAQAIRGQLVPVGASADEP